MLQKSYKNNWRSRFAFEFALSSLNFGDFATSMQYWWTANYAGYYDSKIKAEVTNTMVLVVIAVLFFL